MASIELFPPAILEGGTNLTRLLSRLALSQGAVPYVGEENRERRAFVQKMLLQNPDAFSSDLDVHAMMQHFPSHFRETR